MAFILHIDDDQQLLSLLRAVLQAQGHEVVSASDGREGFARFQERAFDLVISDIQMPVMDGLQLLEAIMNDRLDTPVIMATSADEIQTALNALKIGAFDYVLKPFKLPVLVQTIQRALAVDVAISCSVPSEAAMSEYCVLPGTVAVSQEMRAACDMVRRAAPFQMPHLITGEAGTGRKLLARCLHGLSDRRDGPFIQCACTQLASGQSEQPSSAASRTMTGDLEREFGAILIEANHGTLLLEDVEALPLGCQDRLLRVIHPGVPGDGSPTPCDVRVLATTRKDLHALAESGAMREALVSVLTVMPIIATPLRARIDDILPLTWHFLQRFAGDRDSVPVISHGARAALEHYDWPGNTGELSAAVQEAFKRCRTGRLEMGDFPAWIVGSPENWDVGRVLSGDESHRGQAFREHLAKKLADQFQWGTPPHRSRMRQPGLPPPPPAPVEEKQDTAKRNGFGARPTNRFSDPVWQG